MVLVIDDDTDTLTYLFDVLTSEGYGVATAFDPRQGLATAAEQKPDVVVLDYSMPWLDGVEVLRDLRQVSPDSRVVMISGVATAESMHEAMDGGAVGVLTKPARPDAILDAIRRAFAQGGAES